MAQEQLSLLEVFEVLKLSEKSSSISNSLHQQAPNGRLLDHRRKAQIVSGGPQNHTGEVVEGPMLGFDITKTIFKTLDPALAPMIEKRFAIELTWSDSALDRINSQVEAMLSGDSSHWGALKAHAPALLSFLENDCDFNCEHADGSFLDHLQFCYEYCHIHFPAASPVVLFLHSIMGVGTNLFPMKLEQRPQLAELVTAEELAHIEAFPAVLRLLQTGLLEELSKMPKEQLLGIEGIECYRLLGPEIDTMKKSDNHPLHLTGEQFWVHLNYHLIHFLDFLPASQWEVKMGNESFPLFHRVLTRAGKLMANIQFDSEKWAEVPETPESKQGKAELLMIATNFSGRIGHSLDYKLKLS